MQIQNMTVEHPLNLSLQGKVVLVTGGQVGIGAAIVDLFRRQGAKVLFTSRQPLQADCFELDLSSQVSINGLIGQIEKLPRLDGFINNAGISEPEPIWQLSQQAIERTLMVNWQGAIQLLSSVAKKMQTQRAGRIVNITSIAGLMSKPCSTVYASSKAAMLAATRSAAVDLAPYGVLVNALSPGPTHSPMVERLLADNEQQRIADVIPMGRLAQADEVAKAALFLCADINTYITGQNLIVDGGFTVT